MIKKPISFEADELETIAATLRSKDLGSKTWGLAAIEELRRKIKQYYIKEQDYQCCYCRQRLFADHGRPWDIEHVIAMALKAKFMFEPRNLAVACVECNGEKRAKPVTDNRRVGFPEQSEQYWIVHPHFDEWDEHIELEGETTYKALTKKGKFTIYNCDLFRFWQREAKIRQPIRDKRFQRDVGELRFAKSQSEARTIVASILERVKIEEERAATAKHNPSSKGSSPPQDS